MVIAVEHGGDVVFYHGDRTLNRHSLKFFTYLLTAPLTFTHRAPPICHLLLILQNMSCHHSILRPDVKTQSLITSTIDSPHNFQETLVYNI